MLSSIIDALMTDIRLVDPVEVIIRLLSAMLIGAVIGTEREYTRRPAGMRTHMLVALGACVVMLMGQVIFKQYSALGGSPDPTRLAAQVITGVGFLGAGTILREGHSVRGLTTAASLWAVACLGIAVGAGYYSIAFAGAICIFATLTIFEWVQRKLMGNRDMVYCCYATGTDVAALWERIRTSAEKMGIATGDLELKRHHNGTATLSFRIRIKGKGSEEKLQNFLAEVGEDVQVESLRSAPVRN